MLTPTKKAPDPAFQAYEDVDKMELRLHLKLDSARRYISKSQISRIRVGNHRSRLPSRLQRPRQGSLVLPGERPWQIKGPCPTRGIQGTEARRPEESNFYAAGGKLRQRYTCEGLIQLYPTSFPTSLSGVSTPKTGSWQDKLDIPSFKASHHAPSLQPIL
ncbi:hypothetical protein SRHO_G00234650 [Serrasalmus rhombeus]